MMAFNVASGRSALVAATEFAAGGDGHIAGRPPPSHAALLFLLRRVAVQPQPSDTQVAHMRKVVEALSFDDSQPRDAHECMRLLLQRGAPDV
ncbi:hypothetical protein FOA52_012975 [Chlamydomonas sp. UWO 241]|nr:hypothetical protein FOA52_012975 [Chlamydomonas sp. UWO 241]